ncbi:tetratricopeptide repeat protein [Sulfuricurvum sp.]|uniref:tetratricopeptide repeat protein n=1 Tax=Sulfuricurvum sp. TaxID=2025608 RepID=UPI002629C3B0|nr:tetratricopeptide repeat protein [Sulfuricurvum sp.]MDD2782417.1 tetratricopeptide repeat protein [Sulfuricurvum sp.]
MKKYLYLLALFTFSLFGSNQQIFWDTYTAALRGDKEAQFLVGVIYERGMAVDQNLSAAAQWFEKSAAQGHVDAQYNIGLMYAIGKGVTENHLMADKWLRRAAEQGDGDAEKLLSKLQIDPLKETSSTSEEGIITIRPTVLYTKENVSVCRNDNVCTLYKMPMVFTTISKRGTYYKINGIVSKKGWKRYMSEGWIAENSIDHKK